MGNEERVLVGWAADLYIHGPQLSGEVSSVCMNYNEGRCTANNDKKCLLSEEGSQAEQGKCELHGEYSVWRLRDRVVVTKKTGEYPGARSALGRGINFLTADELAYRKSKRLKVSVDYDLD